MMELCFGVNVRTGSIDFNVFLQVGSHLNSDLSRVCLRQIIKFLYKKNKTGDAFKLATGRQFDNGRFFKKIVLHRPVFCGRTSYFCSRVLHCH